MSFFGLRWLPGFAADAADLLLRATRGDSAALDALYRQESGPVYRYALALCGNEAWAADALQDAFVALLHQPAGFDAAKGSLGAYLCGMARHHLLATRRDRLHTAAPLDEDDDTTDHTEWAPDPQDQLLRMQSLQALHQALAGLPWHQREALVLVDLQERDYIQAADIAGIPVNTLKTRVLRGRRRLHAVLSEATQSPSTSAHRRTL